MTTKKRLIDANLLIGTCEEIAKHEWNKKSAPVSWSDAYEGFIDTIDEMPTVDAVEVVRGRWENHKCTNCGGAEPGYYDHIEDCIVYTPTAFCSNCGARMDKERS